MRRRAGPGGLFRRLIHDHQARLACRGTLQSRRLGPGHAAAAPVSPVIAGQPGAPPKIPGALSPAQLVAAYDVGPLLSRGITGKGQTIAIIDPFGSPTIKQDLAAYDKAWHLPAPPSFQVITPEGLIPPFRPSGNRIHAVRETTMDVEAAHVMAPGAAILLVEMPFAALTLPTPWCM